MYVEEVLINTDGTDGVSKKAKLAEASAMTKKVTTTGMEGSVFEEVFSVFYSKLKQTKDYHSKNLTAMKHEASSNGGGAAVQDAQDMLRAMEGGGGKRVSRPDVDGFDLNAQVADAVTPPTSGDDISRLFNFSGEEVFGKYLDLTTSHLKSLNMEPVFADPAVGKKKPGTMSYAAFCSLLLSVSSKGSLSFPGGVSQKVANRKKYVKFLQELYDYLLSFLRKTSPLLDVDSEVLKLAASAFEAAWVETEASKWGVEVVEEKEDFDVNKFKTAAALEKKLGPEGLKVELGKLGLKQGGSVKQRAERLFALKGKKLEDLPKKFFAKGGAPVVTAATTAASEGGGAVESTSISGTASKKEIAALEAAIAALLMQLRPVLDATSRRAERRTTQTVMERKREREEEITGTLRELKGSGDGDDSDSDEEEEIYNPKKVPLGWDGKPIPYWLFKLHGLNKYFKCEICGNESYRGQRDFEKHFTEPKHNHGMKVLGIPNTKHFHGVVLIEDAKKLWAKMQEKGAKSKAQQRSQAVGSNGMEEYEDSQGNVLSRTEYEDLARQGLL
ncbi:hypothetical protein TrRE_jg11050 [Triparma retinervis]|uniref:Uncharacterized protein n=1 Tax=Triparma retinervis TaxID=2557542 RepID=A0A9W7G3L3_9STRA|nr:hypothetical protein TrRE_jg11050 [Triparma retinervis]